MLLEARDDECSDGCSPPRRVALLIIDELGFVPFDRAGGELLFNLIADRYERRSTLVTTNLAFSECPLCQGSCRVCEVDSQGVPPGEKSRAESVGAYAEFFGGVQEIDGGQDVYARWP